MAGRTAQAYNARKRRHGAFWQDRYHATAVESGAHPARCVAYIDLNMVRAGVVQHPAQWKAGGYHEIQGGRQRYRIVNRGALAEVLGVEQLGRLALTHAEWIASALQNGAPLRVPEWSESLAVGSRGFVARVGSELGVRAQHQQIAHCGDFSALRDPGAPYGRHLGAEIAPLSGV